jgi:hypothetical protein
MMRKTALLGLILCLFPSFAFAQLSTCAVSGVIYDVTGTPKANVKIRLLRVEQSGQVIATGYPDIKSAANGTWSVNVPRSSTAWFCAPEIPVAGISSNCNSPTKKTIPNASSASFSALVTVVQSPTLGITVRDEGTALANPIGTLNFVGNGVTVTESSAGVAQVSISSGGGSDPVTASRALVSDGDGLVAASAVTATELGYVSGVTSALQTQLNAKQASGNYITALTGDGTASGPGSAAFTLATVNSNVGSFGGAAKTLTATANGKGLVTAIAETDIAIAGNQITSGAIDAARLPDLSGTYQPLNANLTTIGGLSPTDDDILQRKAGAWTNRTVSQFKADLGLAAIATSGSASDLGAGTVPLARLSGITTAELSATAGITNAQLAGSIDLTSKVTGTLPVANGGTGITALGTGIATALGVNVGSAGAPVLFNGAGGTPSSLTLTNGTGLPPTTGISGWPANSAGVLTNNGSGTLSWGASGGTTINASDGAIPYRSNSTTFTDSPLSVASSAVVMTRNSLGTTNATGIELTNTTAAAAGAQQVSPDLVFTAQGWKTTATAASQTVNFRQYVLPVQGATNPTANWVLQSQINGGGYSDKLVVTSDGMVQTKASSNGFQVFNGANIMATLQDISGFARLGFTSSGSIAWSSSTTNVSSIDVGIGRQGIGALRVNNASTGAGSLILGTNANAIGTSGVAVLAIGNSTAPSTSPADQVQVYAIDAAAGDQNLYSRNEAGEINRLTGLSARVGTQFDKTSNTTLGNITNLTRNVEAGRTYGFTAVLYTTSNVAGGVKAAISGTATATSIIYEASVTDAGVGATIGTARATALDTTVGDVTAVTAARITITGTIVVNSAGTLTVQFAQNASNGSASSVLVNSSFNLVPIT